MMRTSNMKIIGQDANGKNLCVCHFECDSAADLPAYNVYQSDGYVFAMSCTAHTIDTDKKYELDSGGNWVEQSQPWQPLADYSVLSNKPKINGHTLTGNQSGADLGLQNVLTFDSTPMQSSTNPVTSVGIWTDQQRQEAEIGVVANAGAKNLLKVSVADAKSNAGNAGFTWKGNTASKNHVNFTINSDLKVDVSSDTGYNASDTTIFYLTDGSGAYPNTILNGCPSGGSSTTYELRTATPVKSDYGSGVEITSDSTTNVVIIIRSGWSGELTFKPMIRPAAITDPTFQPYAKTNPELTVLTDEDRSELAELVDNGDKNKLHYDGISAPSGDTANISFAISGDTITITGSTLSNAAWCYLTLSGSIVAANDFCNGKYFLSSERTGTGTADVFAYETGVGQFADDSGNGVVIPNKSTSSAVRIMVNIPKGATVSITLKIMICTTAAWKISKVYQPYRPSWQEMYDMILALQ